MCKLVEDYVQKEKIEFTVSLIKDGLLAVEEAAKRLNMNKEDLEKLLEA